MFPTHPNLAQKVPFGSGLVKLRAFIFSRTTRDCWLIYSYYQKSLPMSSSSGPSARLGPVLCPDV